MPYVKGCDAMSKWQQPLVKLEADPGGHDGGYDEWNT